MNIRPATPEDADRVLALWSRAAARHSLVDDVEVVEQLVRRDPHALLLAEVDGELVGTLIVGWDGWRCHLYRLAVDDAYRRRGIGRALLAAAAERAAALGAPRLDAVVLDDNDEGQEFWSAEGFTHDGDVERWSRLLD